MEGKWDTSKRVSEIVLEILRENNLGGQMLEHRAIDLWKVIVGPTVNRMTKNVYVNDGVMYVELTSSVVRQELLMLKSKILENFETAVGKNIITDIVFK